MNDFKYLRLIVFVLIFTVLPALTALHIAKECHKTRTIVNAYIETLK